jgi:hypothetical protein
MSGSSPDGDVGFKSLKELGVKTVISVDGAKPDIDHAHKYGFRYVHIPFGYDGITRRQVLRLARAVRDLPGPIYIHCHHGIHRGPAAAAAIHFCLDSACTVEQALGEMRRAGTDPRYKGLYETVRTLVRPTPKELDAVSATFPDVEKVSDLAQLMVQIDARWDNLKPIKVASWEVPADHPDLDPPHEAVQLAELFQEAARLRHAEGENFRQRFAEARREAGELEQALKDKDRRATRQLADKAFARIGTSCSQCHAKYRDLPH